MPVRRLSKILLQWLPIFYAPSIIKAGKIALGKSCVIENERGL